MQKVLKTNLNPNEKHLANIESWLKEEWAKTSNGFYSNWHMIPQAFAEKRLSVITENDYAIGFIVYRLNNLTATIDVAEIKPVKRQKGYATRLVDETLEFFKSKGVLAVQLFCAPESSEPFWKRIGFLNFPVIPHLNNLHMYKTLVETVESSENEIADLTIKLWDCEPYQVRNKSPKWIWNLSFKEDNQTLKKPIVFPAYRDWQIELAKSDATIIIDKIKYCGIDLADYGRFLIIRKVDVLNKY